MWLLVWSEPASPACVLRALPGPQAPLDLRPSANILTFLALSPSLAPFSQTPSPPELGVKQVPVVCKLPSLLLLLVAVNISRTPTNDKDSSKCSWVDTVWEVPGLHKDRECSAVRMSDALTLVEGAENMWGTGKH